MHSGSELHARHGRMLIISGCLRWIAYALLLVAIIILTINLTNGSALFS